MLFRSQDIQQDKQMLYSPTEGQNSEAKHGGLQKPRGNVPSGSTKECLLPQIHIDRSIET